MDTHKRGATPDMQVTSIRLEPELKERLRQISGERGYQFLMREVLWQFVEQQVFFEPLQSMSRARVALPWKDDALENLEKQSISSQSSRLSKHDIRVIFRAIAQQEEQCAMTGQLIQPQQMMWLGFTKAGTLVPLSHESMAEP
jgi:hypothetical protein